MGRNILIINLTRMGDLLQSTPLIEGIKQGEKESSITLLVNSAFSSICSGIPGIDELIEFDLNDLRMNLKDTGSDFIENYRKVEHLVGLLNRKHYDLTINLTHSPLSAVLTSLIDTDEIRGFTIDPEGHRLIKNKWMRYFFNVVPNRRYNPFHIVDIYMMAGGAAPVSQKLLYYHSEEETERADNLLQECGVHKDDLLVGLQMGASKEDRRWPVEKFADVADRLAGIYGARILLFGTGAEAALADDFGKYARTKPVNLIGRTGLGELAAVLARCSLLIGNDTGTLHIATASNTKVLGIFSVNAYYMETGPYGIGHYVLEADLPCLPCGFDAECKNRICRDVISPDAVYDISRYILDGENGTIDYSSPVWQKINVMRSSFGEDGVLSYEPVIRKNMRKEDIYRHYYRQIWLNEFDDRDGAVNMVCGRINEEVSKSYILDDRDGISSSVNEDLEDAERLNMLASAGLDNLEKMASEASKKSPDTDKLKTIWLDVEKTETAIDLIANTAPFLRPIVILFRYAREAMQGEGILELSGTACLIYRELVYYISRLIMLMKNSSQVTQPAAMEEITEYREEQKSGAPWYL